MTLALLGTGCIVEAPGSGGGQQSSAAGRPARTTEAPPLEVRVGANLEDKIELVSARLEPGRALPGEMVKVTTFYKVKEPLPQDYMIFVHVEDPDGKEQRVNYDHPPAGGRPTSDWKKDETITDSFSVQVPAGSDIRGLNVWLGFWHPATDTRLRLVNPQAVRNDGSNRILVATLPVGR